MPTEPSNAPQRETTIGFDDLEFEQGYGHVPDGYNGFRWSGFGAYERGNVSKHSGYAIGITSGDQAGYTDHKLSAIMTLPHGTFTLQSVKLTAAWDTQLTVDVYGYRGGVEKYHVTLSIGDAAPTLAELGFEQVHQVVFVPGKGVHDDKQPFRGNEFAFDDLVFSDFHQRPAPSPLDLAAFHADRPVLGYDFAHVDFTGPHPLA